MRVRLSSKRVQVLGILLFACSVAFGQVSQISGTAKDQSGAVVPGVQIAVTQTDTGIKRTTVTDDNGAYILPNLPLGPYRLEAGKMGFRSYVQTGIVLQVGASPEIPVTMGVGQVNESVQVEANATLVETRNIGVGNVIETQRILDLPLNGRQATDLITLGGAASLTTVGATVAMRTGVRVAVAGGHDYSVQYNLDGASHLETYSGTGMPLPFPEALQEFRLVTSTQDASGGGHSSASVNAVTKSGTNAFHGDAFWFLRNAALNGRDFFATTGDALKRNQFGGVIGGAIKKDKLFFFTGYQGTFIRQTPTGTPENVPTAKMLTGDFSDYVANHCGSFNPGVLDSNNHFTRTMSPAALKIAALLPKTSDPCGLVYTSNPLSENDLQVPARIDYQKSEKQSIFGRYVATRIDTKVPHSINPNDILNAGAVGADDMTNSLTIGDTYVVSPTFVNSFRVFGNRMGSNHPYAQTFGPNDVGIKNFYTYLPGLMSMTVAGGPGFSLGIPANFVHTDTGYTNFGFNEDVNVIRGAHQLSFGVNALRAILVGNNFAWSEGFMVFVGGIPAPFSTGSGLGDFLTGTIINLHQGNPNPNWTRQNFGGAYASDVWKVSSRLTVNMGLRWNPFIPLQFTQSDTTNFSLSNFYAGVRSTAIPNAPPGFSYPGDAGFNGRSGMDGALNHFEPRLGLAWDPFGDGKMVIRAGAGIAYDFINQGVHMNSSTVDPFRTTVILNGPLSLDNPYANVSGGNPFPYTYDPKHPSFNYSSPYQAFYLMPKDLKTTEQYQWNLGIQRQFTPAFFASATYLGSQLIHVWTAVDLNPGQYIPGTCKAGQYGLTAPGACTQSGNVDQRRLLNITNPAGAGNVLGSMIQMDAGGTQRYNALLLSATWRKQNVNLSGNYTWSHCIGIPYTNVANAGAAYTHEPYQNNGPADRHQDYGDCVVGNLDQRHIGNVTMVVNTPKASGDKWSNRLVSNWSISTIFTARTGWPISPALASDVAMNGLYASGGGYQIQQRPNQIMANTSPTQASCSPAPCVPWFNPNAFQSPAAGTYGNMAMAALRGPGFWEWDQAIIRDFKVTEGQTIQFRAEVFNLTNSVRFNISSSSAAAGADTSTQFGSSHFGQIYNSASTTGSTSLTGSGGRVFQFALKYVF